MKIVASNSLTLSKVNDGTITHTAWSYSADGTDGFTTVYPNLNLLDDTTFKNYIPKTEQYLSVAKIDGGVNNKPYVSISYNNPTANSYTDQISWAFDKEYFKPSTIYTFSFYLKGNGTIRTYVYPSLIDDSSANGLADGKVITPTGDGNYDWNLTSEWVRHTYTFITKSSLTAGHNFLFRIFTGNSADICLPKVEEGSIATPHMPSSSEVTTADWPSYIGQYTDFTQADSTNPSDYTWSLMRGNDGKDGADGTDGIAGKDGKGIKATAITYQASTNGTTAPTGTWSASVPTVAKGSFLWTRTIWTYTDNSTETGYSVAYMGTNGNNGTNGIAGKDGVGIKSTVIEYVGAVSGTIKPTSGWSTTIPTVLAGEYLWTRTTWQYTDGTSEQGFTNALMGRTGANGKDGVAGKDGVGLKSTQIMYAQGTSGTTAPTTSWTAQVPTLIKGQYLWTQTTWVYTDNTGESGYTVSYNAKDGNTGTNGIAGKDGVGIKSTTITYASSTSGTTPPVANLVREDGWTDGNGGVIEQQSHVFYTGTHVLYRLGNTKASEVFAYPKNMMELKPSTKYTLKFIGFASSNVTGMDAWILGTSSDGKTNQYVQAVYNKKLSPTEAEVVTATFTTGDVTTNGQLRFDNNGSSNAPENADLYFAEVQIVEGTTAGPYEVVSPTDSAWSSTPPAVPAGQFIWTKTVWTYTDGTSETGYSVAMMGRTGADGVAGKDGVGLRSTEVTYATSTSGTTAPASGYTASVPSVAKGSYLWTKTVWMYTDNSTETGYSVAYMGTNGNNGTNGVAGKDGVGIANTTITYAPSTSGTTAPASGYTASVPTVAEGSFLWTKTVWSYTDGTNETGYSVAKQGVKGADGKDGKSITDSKQEWAASTSGTTAPTTWQTTIPTVTAGQYLWSRITETWSDNSKTYKFTIGKIGENGQNAQMMFLSATTNQMMFNADNTPKTAQSSVVTAKYQNVTGTVAFTAKGIKTDGTSETLTLTGSGDSRTITSAMFKTDWVMINVTATLAGLTDTLSIVKVNDGAQGIGGKNGYFHSAWAMSADGRVGFSTTDSTGKWYIGTYFDFVEADSTDPARYNWLELAGAVNMHFAYAWSPDGKDRFNREKPNENLWSISNSILGKFQDWSSGLSLVDNPDRFTSDFIPVKEGEEYWISSNYASYIFSVFLYKDTSSNAGLRLNDSNKNANSWVALSSNGGGIPSGGFKIPSGYSYMRLSSAVTNSDIVTVTPDLIISRKVKLEKSDKATIYTPNQVDDYDNAVPRYIGRSLKDSTNPSDFTWEPNPDRKPWTAYSQGLNGEGFSLMPYGENLLPETANLSKGMGTATSLYSEKYNGHAVMKSGISDASTDMYSFRTVTALTGDRYTVSFSARSLKGNRSFRCYFYNPNTTVYGITSTGLTTTNDDGNVYFTVGESLTTFYVTWTQSNNTQPKTVILGRVIGPIIAGEEMLMTEPKLEPANTMGIPTPWTPAPSEDPLGAIPKYVGTAALPYEDFSKYAWDLNPAWLQQESNNNLANKVDNDTYNNDQATVWQEISNRVTEEEAQAIQDSLTNVTNAYTDFVSTGGKHDQDLANLKSAINTDIQKLADKVLGYDFVNTWFRIGDGGLSIGEANSNFEILVSNDQITFYDSGTAVAYVSNQSFFINSGMIVDDLQIGKFKFAKVNDNLMGLFHIA